MNVPSSGFRTKYLSFKVTTIYPVLWINPLTIGGLGGMKLSALLIYSLIYADFLAAYMNFSVS